jgi:hypothetical protein
MLETLPPKETHLEALSRKGVMREAVRVGGFGSLDGERADGVVAELVDRFGAKRLLSVPGFKRTGSDGVWFVLREEYVLLPCFGGEGLLSAVEALPVDEKTGEISGEESVPLPGAGGHLYVFAAYRPEELEGFCEGPLGAILAAQNDVVVGAAGGFRRYRADSGPSSGRQLRDAVLPELDGVDFGGREVAHVPRAGAAVGEENARYHEATRAARWLVEKQGGRPRVATVREAGREAGPTSLAEWILSLPEDETRERLRELFSRSPHSRTRKDSGPDGGLGMETEVEAEQDRPPSLSPRLAAAPAVVGAVLAVVLYLGLARLKDFSEHAGVGPFGEPRQESGLPGILRALAGSAPAEVLYAAPAATSLLAGVGLFLWRRAGYRRLERRAAKKIRVDNRWDLHERPRKEPPPAYLITTTETLWAALVWPTAYLVSDWLLKTTEHLLVLAAELSMVPGTKSLVGDPTFACSVTATLAATFVLWRRRTIRLGEARMLGGKIDH